MPPVLPAQLPLKGHGCYPGFIDGFGELGSQTVVRTWGQLITAIRVSLVGASGMQNRTEPFLVSLPSHV